MYSCILNSRLNRSIVTFSVVLYLQITVQSSHTSINNCSLYRYLLHNSLSLYNDDSIVLLYMWLSMILNLHISLSYLFWCLFNIWMLFCTIPGNNTLCFKVVVFFLFFCERLMLLSAVNLVIDRWYSSKELLLQSM